MSHLGVGATSVVYKVKVPRGVAGQAQPLEAAAKVALPLFQQMVADEAPVLQSLAAAGCPAVPQVLATLDGGRGYVMQPVGAALTGEARSAHGRLFQLVGPLVDTLRRAHQANWAHGDIRPSNLLLAGPPAARRLLLADWYVIACEWWVSLEWELRFGALQAIQSIQPIQPPMGFGALQAMVVHAM